MMAILCVPQAQFSGLFMHKYQEWTSESACSGVFENPLKVLITSYKHFTTSEASTYKLFFTYGAQKPHKPPKFPR